MKWLSVMQHIMRNITPYACTQTDNQSKLNAHNTLGTNFNTKKLKLIAQYNSNNYTSLHTRYKIETKVHQRHNKNMQT